MPFADIVGHEQAIDVLRRAAASGHVAQAYLLVGPPNVGKTMLAKEFARALNCERLVGITFPEQIEPCGVCHNCVRIGEENHPDLLVVRPGIKVETRNELPEDRRGRDQEAEEVSPEDEEADVQAPAAAGLFDAEPVPVQDGPNLFGEKPAPPPKARQRIGRVGFYIEMPDAEIIKEAVEDVLRRASSTLSSGTRHRVLIVTEADRIRHDSVDRLLKTLEEPPPGTSFVLTTSNLASVRDTIVSRCQTIKLQPLTGARMLQELSARMPDRDQTQLRGVTAMSAGRFGRAKFLLEHPEAMAARAALLDIAAASADGMLAECMVMGERLVQLVDEWLAATDQSLVGASDAAGHDADRLAQLREKAIAEHGRKSPDRFRRIAMNQLLDMLQSWYRDLELLRSARDSGLVINSDRREELVALAPRYSQGGLRFASETIEAARTDLLRHNANMRMACEVLLCKLIASRRRK